MFRSPAPWTSAPAQLWPLAFGGLWAILVGSVLRLLPVWAARVGFGIVYFLMVIYAGVQTGYYLMFSQMMWLSDFRYASEGADYADVLLSYPLGWWLGLAGLLILGAVVLWRFPLWQNHVGKRLMSGLLAVSATVRDLPSCSG